MKRLPRRTRIIRTMFLVTTMLLGFALWLYGELKQPVGLLSPKGLVEASEPTPTPTTSPKITNVVIGEVKAAEVKETQKQEILHYIVNKFGDDADKMITIIGTCENGKWNQSATNHNRNGSTDYGIAQINDLNGKRDAQCKGLDYRNNWQHNLDCAYIIYKSQGLKAWACSHKVGVTPFYMEKSK